MTNYNCCITVKLHRPYLPLCQTLPWPGWIPSMTVLQSPFLSNPIPSPEIQRSSKGAGVRGGDDDDTVYCVKVKNTSDCILYKRLFKIIIIFITLKKILIKEYIYYNILSLKEHVTTLSANYELSDYLLGYRCSLTMVVFEMDDPCRVQRNQCMQNFRNILPQKNSSV